jgi:hypothetical protein
MSRFLLPRTDLPELRELRKSNILPNTHASIFGLTNWLLKQNVVDTDIDPLRIQIKRHSFTEKQQQKVYYCH